MHPHDTAPPGGDPRQAWTAALLARASEMVFQPDPRRPPALARVATAQVVLVTVPIGWVDGRLGGARRQNRPVAAS